MTAVLVGRCTVYAGEHLILCPVQSHSGQMMTSMISDLSVGNQWLEDGEILVLVSSWRTGRCDL